MELKKNPKADIKKNSPFYYAVGIAAVMLITYLGIIIKHMIRQILFLLY